MPDGSLRERKRARLRRELIETAVSLFRDRGFSATPVRAILDRVEISEATFFNHFPTKDALLAAWASERLEALVPPVGGLGAGVRATVRSALRRLGEALEADASLAREAWSRLRVGGPERATPWWALLRAGQASGELREDLPAEELARILAAALDAELARWAGPESEGAASPLAQRLQRAADLVLDGCRKRHERVRASPRAARPSPSGPPSGHRRL